MTIEQRLLKIEAEAELKRKELLNPHVLEDALEIIEDYDNEKYKIINTTN